MLRTDLIDILNSKTAWAFLGSGTSIGAGLPSWGSLVTRVLDELDADVRASVESEDRFQRSVADKNFPRCFSVIESAIGRKDLDRLVRSTVGTASRRSRLLERLVDLPFAGYITTNYDPLIEEYLTQAQQPGWVTVGNRGAELRKLDGQVDHIVWHLHGAISQSDDKSRLVLTEADYDDVYSRIPTHW